MRNKFVASIKIFIILIMILGVFTNSEVINSSIIFGINMFINNIFPSLFPMFIISELLISIKIPEYLGYKFQYLFKKLFNCSGYASFVFFMSMLTGFPSSAKYINDLIKKDLISSEEANNILKFTFFANPLFIINTIGISILGNKLIGIAILFVNFISNILIGIVFKSKTNNSYSMKIKEVNLIEEINKSNFFKTIITAIYKGINILINIFGVIIFCLICLNILNNYIELSKLGKVLFTGSIEMTSGIKLINTLNNYNYIKYLIVMGFVAFGGLSIHMQMFSILDNKKIRYISFLKARIVHLIISLIILLLVIKLLNI